MEPDLKSYEGAKQSIRETKAEERSNLSRPGDMGIEPTNGSKSIELSDVAQVGGKVLIGGGIGLLAGVAAIGVAASAAEIIVAGVVTKIAGVVGGAMGLSLGMNKYKKKRKKMEDDSV
jgi:hypothetical protein